MKKEFVNPEIEFAEGLPHFFAEGTYTEAEGTPEEYENGLVKRFLAKEEDAPDIEYYRWKKSIAPLDECIRFDIDDYNTGSPDLMIAGIDCFNEPGDGKYTLTAFPCHLRDNDYLAEICYFEVGDDYLGFEMLSRTRAVSLAETGLALSVPKKAKEQPVSEEDRSAEGLVHSFAGYQDWLPAMEIYVWDKDGDMDFFQEYISRNFVLRDAVKKPIRLAGGKEIPGMELRYESRKPEAEGEPAGTEFRGENGKPKVPGETATAEYCSENGKHGTHGEPDSVELPGEKAGTEFRGENGKPKAPGETARMELPNENIEWLLDLGGQYASVRFTFPSGSLYAEVVARGIFASLS